MSAMATRTQDRGGRSETQSGVPNGCSGTHQSRSSLPLRKFIRVYFASMA
jgi:hypothetical protein